MHIKYQPIPCYRPQDARRNLSVICLSPVWSLASIHRTDYSAMGTKFSHRQPSVLVAKLGLDRLRLLSRSADHDTIPLLTTIRQKVLDFNRFSSRS